MELFLRYLAHIQYHLCTMPGNVERATSNRVGGRCEKTSDLEISMRGIAATDAMAVDVVAFQNNYVMAVDVRLMLEHQALRTP